MIDVSEFHDTRTVFEFGKQALREGKSLGHIEFELRTTHGLSSYLVDRSMPLITAYANAQTLSRISYRSWIKKLNQDLYAGGLAGAWLVMMMVPICLFICIWVLTSLRVTSSAAQDLAPFFAAACAPLAWVVGWPVFMASRYYWRWRIRQLDSIRDLDALDTSRLPRDAFFT